MDPEVDAQWKKIQEKTFTRWVNEQLKVQKVSVKSLTEDFKDGVLLIVLLEVLSQKSIGKYNKKPKIHVQKMENLQKALSFIGKEGIRLVNIGKAICLMSYCNVDYSRVASQLTMYMECHLNPAVQKNSIAKQNEFTK